MRGSAPLEAVGAAFWDDQHELLSIRTEKQMDDSVAIVRVEQVKIKYMYVYPYNERNGSKCLELFIELSLW